MNKYKIKHSIVLIDGRETLICARDFLMTQLKDKELQSFLADKVIVDNYDQQAVADGLYERGGITEQMPLEDGIIEEIEVAEYHNRNIEVSPFHPLWMKWLERFYSDPRIIKLEKLEQIS